jgi:predicted transcriptional regulator
MTFGQFARQKRLEAGLSLDTVAHALGYSHRSNVYRLEHDLLEWKLTSAVKLAELLGNKTSELLAEYEAEYENA